MTSERPSAPLRRRVLLVDDDPTMLLITRRLLEDAAPHADVTEARSGEEGMGLLRERDFDVVVSDYRMALANGVDVLALALARRPQAIRLLMSGYGDPAMVREARKRAQIHGFLEKPIAVDDLEAVLRAQLVTPYLLAKVTP